MALKRNQSIEIRSSNDIVLARQLVRTWSVEQGFGLVDQTKLVTAASELARNMVLYADGGILILESLEEGMRVGLRLIFEDHGPGIADLPLAMKDGYSTGSGLGVGLSGSKRLVNEFDIVSRPGEGTRVSITRWR